MAAIPLTLPVLQNWSCHNCGGCCTQHLIEITDAERQRILDQQWTADDNITQPPVEWHAGPPWNKRYRLAHRPDGGCVFLNEQGLCRIHAKFGEAAKPLACRVYPYALHPHGKTVTVSLRFSCPSIVANRGRTMKEQQRDIQQIAELLVPPNFAQIRAPRLTNSERPDWPVLLKFVEHLDAWFRDVKTPLLVRLFRVLAWTNLVEQSRFEGLSTAQVQEFLQLIQTAVAAQFAAVPDPIDAPGTTGRLYFRMLVAQYARKDTVSDLSAGLWQRWKLLRAIMAFTRGRGLVPPLQSGFTAVPFADLEPAFGGLPEGADELFTRYFRVKIQGLHFCGPAFYGVPFVEGVNSLLLMFPVTLWIARWKAKSLGRDRLQLADVEHALAIADHHYGYSPALGQSQRRGGVRYLARTGELGRLCVWYAK